MKVKLILISNFVDFLVGSGAQPAMLAALTSPPLICGLTDRQQETSLSTLRRAEVSPLGKQSTNPVYFSMIDRPKPQPPPQQQS